MRTFHIDEPREIGKRRDRVSSKDLKMVKTDLAERVLRKKIREIISRVLGEAIKPSEHYGFYKITNGKKIVQFKGSKSDSRKEMKKAKKIDPRSKYGLIQSYKFQVGDKFK